MLRDISGDLAKISDCHLKGDLSVGVNFFRLFATLRSTCTSKHSALNLRFFLTHLVAQLVPAN